MPLLRTRQFKTNAQIPVANGWYKIAQRKPRLLATNGPTDRKIVVDFISSSNSLAKTLLFMLHSLWVSNLSIPFLVLPHESPGAVDITPTVPFYDIYKAIAKKVT
ncbi:MAG: hypothetical protein JWM21_3840 [Acidobacteria bacterium]|nr:hypothetical protein [Acidobacteriota bacterium]